MSYLPGFWMASKAVLTGKAETGIELPHVSLIRPGIPLGCGLHPLVLCKGIISDASCILKGQKSLIPMVFLLLEHFEN